MDLEQALHGEGGTDRTAAIVGWFQSLFAGDPPVLVGGATVELYTGGAYKTGDFDFVGRVTDEATRSLEEAGFRKRGRHWVHEGAQIYIELPAPSFDRPVRIDAIRMGEWTVVLLSPEDVLVDRLAAWKFWKVPVEGINSYLLYRARGSEMDGDRLEAIAAAEGVADALDSLRRLATRARDPGEIERWAAEMR